jgi:hypothetical protein
MNEVSHTTTSATSAASSYACSTEMGRGLAHDIQRRLLPHYLSDWTGLCHHKILSSTCFIFFTSVAPSITFSLYISESTKNELGAIEILLATGITGCLMSLFAGQPLLIVGVTGPVAILTASIYQLSESFGVKFLPFFAWSQLWAALFHILLAVFNACDLVYVVTQFSCETFGILIALIYIYTGLRGIADSLHDTTIPLASSLLELILALGTVFLAQYLSYAKEWTSFNETIRILLSDYSATIAVIFFSAVPFMAAERLEEPVPTLYVPAEFATTSGRDWFPDFLDIPVWGIFAAIFPGIIITILFFFDHNVSSLIAQDKEMQLQKGTAFHLDLLVLGIGVFLTGMLGLPPTNGLIPQAPLHVKSLVEKQRVYKDGMPTESFTIVGVHEQRFTNLFQSVLCAIVAVPPFSIALRQIPQSVLYGLFLYLGISSFEGNAFAYRMSLFTMESIFRDRLSEQEKFPFLRTLPFTRIAYFTTIQATVCLIIFGITFTPAGVIFPILIALLILLRLYGLDQIFGFTVEELDVLDRYIVSGQSTRENVLPVDTVNMFPDEIDAIMEDTDDPKQHHHELTLQEVVGAIVGDGMKEEEVGKAVGKNSNQHHPVIEMVEIYPDPSNLS